MKRIAIFIDGTWNRPDAEHPTNVLRLSRTVSHRDDDDVPQVVIYAAGVGSGRGNTRLGRFSDRTFGGIFGWGTMAIIEDVYRQLVMLYQTGDEIQLFGFSRGAFAARSLAGVIRSCGIPPREHVHRIPEALERYASRDPTTKPETTESYEFRADISPTTATSADEFDWRRKQGDDASVRLMIDYLGVWDTVKALGLPEKLTLSDRVNAQYRFHDDALSSSVLSARHAIAIDERRATFPALPWGNLDQLNRDRNGAYLQQYFPGNHGSVGGGGEELGLSSITLHWIAMGAAQAGLKIEWEAFDRTAYDFDPFAPLVNKRGATPFFGKLLALLSDDRPGPDLERNLSLCALDRYYVDEDYRPETLKHLKDELFKMSEGEVDHLRRLMIERDGGQTHVRGQLMRPRQKIERIWR